jgi:tetratricopeptide (TPR) repeat protein
MLALVVVSIIIAIIEKKTRWYIIPVLFLIPILAFAVRHESLGSPFNFRTLQMRTVQWVPTLSMIIDNPYGVGAGNWWVNFPEYAKNIDFENAYVLNMFRFPHNDYLWVCSETGIGGAVCYVGMLVLALKRSDKWLLLALAGYVTIACFSALRERPFSSMMLVIFLSQACQRKWTVKHVRLSLVVLVFFMVVLGFRFRSSYWNKKLMRSESYEQLSAATVGYSPFSQLTYTGIPYYWWQGMCSLNDKKKGLAIKQLRIAYKHNPNSVHAINGMGISYGLEKDNRKAEEYFRKALEICPDFETAKINLKKVTYGYKN